MKPNIFIGRELKNRLEGGTETLSDRVQLVLADYAAGIFPKFSVYTEPQKQLVKPPAVFIDLFSVDYTRLLARTVQYEFGFSISYWPADTLASSELNEAVLRMTRGITLLPDFPVQRVESDITDGVIGITGVIKTRETLDDDSLIIAQAEQELTKKG